MKLKKSTAWISLLAMVFLWVPRSMPAAEGSAGATYGRNIFAGAFVGGLIGAAAGLIPYSQERKNTGARDIPYAATYGAIGTAVLIGPLLSAYERGSQKQGSGTTVLFSTLGFAVLGASAGAGWSLLDYQHQVGTATEDNAEIILWNAGYGALGGAALGFLSGLWEVMIWRESDSLERPPGSGIHADLHFLRPGTHIKGPHRARYLPHMKLAEWQF